MSKNADLQGASTSPHVGARKLRPTSRRSSWILRYPYSPPLRVFDQTQQSLIIFSVCRLSLRQLGFIIIEMHFQRQAKPSNRIVSSARFEKGVLQSHSSAKCVAAFLRYLGHQSPAWVPLADDAAQPANHHPDVVFLEVCCSALSRHRGYASTGRDGCLNSDQQLPLGHLIDRLDFEFFGLTRVAYGTSLASVLRQRSVYETRGDSGGNRRRLESR